MDDKSKQIAQRFKETVAELYGDRLAKVVLYGSYARGDYHEESDMDFLVVLKDGEVKNLEEVKKMVSPVNELILDYNLDISFLPMSLEKFQTAENPLLLNIRNEGIEIL